MKINIKKIYTIIFTALLLLFFTGCGFNYVDSDGNNFSVHYIDVGQGDAELICFPDGEVMLIDTGPQINGEKVISYLKQQKIKQIDYVVLTHPHTDHIGGMCAILDNFEVLNVYMPNINKNSIPTTKGYEKTIKALINKNVNVINAVAGEFIKDDSTTSVRILAPNNKYYTYYEDLNNYSIVIRVKYDDMAFIFMGDAQKLSEEEIMQNFYDIKSDVIKCGHHGSATSNCRQFLRKVNPKFAIISCERNNRYGYPDKYLLRRLRDKGVKVYRTDLNGNIVFKKIEKGYSITVDK